MDPEIEQRFEGIKTEISELRRCLDQVCILGAIHQFALRLEIAKFLANQTSEESHAYKSTFTELFIEKFKSVAMAGSHFGGGEQKEAEIFEKARNLAKSYVKEVAMLEQEFLAKDESGQ